ncbi:MAG: hypothetical protein COA79_03035 [Planctomycetota bacterium]|nr:MAG: hypothetical protein COA79_03035 [Planctomycetota bacterium]
MITVNITPSNQRYIDAIISRFKKYSDINLTTCGEWGVNYIQAIPEIIKGKPDLLHIQWPESALGGLESYEDKFKFIDDLEEQFKKLKESNIKIIWTQHNILPHDRHEDIFFQQLYELYSQYANGLIHHSNWGKKYFHETYQSNALDAVIRHGAFADEAIYFDSTDKARLELNFDPQKRIFLTLGGVKEYKNTIELLECFENRQKTQDFLVICIKDKDSNPYRRKAFDLATKLNNVRVFDGFMDAENLAIYARASDAFIFAYGESSLTSGSPHLSQAHGIPQITLRSPYSEEVMGEAGLFFNPEPSITEGLYQYMEALDNEKLSKAKKYFESIPSDYQWDTIAKQTFDFYQEVLK